MPLIPASQKKNTACHFWGGIPESYLAALARTDAIVVSRGLVLADEAGLVDSGRGRRGRRAGDELLRTGALRLNGCRECKQEKTEDEEACFQMTEWFIETSGARKGHSCLKPGNMAWFKTASAQLISLHFIGPDTWGYQLTQRETSPILHIKVSLMECPWLQEVYGVMLVGWLDCDWSP